MASKIFVSVAIATFFFLSSSDAHAIHPEAAALSMAMKHAEKHAERRSSFINQCSRSGASPDQCDEVMRGYRSDVRGVEETMKSFEMCLEEKGASQVQACSEMAMAWGLLEWLLLPLATSFYLLVIFLYFGYAVPLMVVGTLIKIPLFLIGITETWYLFVSLW